MEINGDEIHEQRKVKTNRCYISKVLWMTAERPASKTFLYTKTHTQIYTHSGRQRDGKKIPGPGEVVWGRISHTLTFELSSVPINCPALIITRNRSIRRNWIHTNTNRYLLHSDIKKFNKTQIYAYKRKSPIPLTSCFFCLFSILTSQRSLPVWRLFSQLQLTSAKMICLSLSDTWTSAYSLSTNLKSMFIERHLPV